MKTTTMMSKKRNPQTSSCLCALVFTFVLVPFFLHVGAAPGSSGSDLIPIPEEDHLYEEYHDEALLEDYEEHDEVEAGEEDYGDKTPDYTQEDLAGFGLTTEESATRRKEESQGKAKKGKRRKKAKNNRRGK